MTQMLARSTAAVKPHVMVVPDGEIFRWQRFDGRTRRTSTEGFLTPAAAKDAAAVIAQCYDVPLLADSVPWAAPDRVARELAEAEIWADESHEAWLADVVGDVSDLPWLADSVEAFASMGKEVGYIPFQHPGAYYADVVGGLADEPGYSESTQPYLW